MDENPLIHFQKALLESMKSFEISEDTKATFNEDLLSETGALERNPYADASGSYRFLRLGFSFWQARSAVQRSAHHRRAIFRLRSLPMSERLEMVRALSWHHRYILRERAKSLSQLLKETREGLALRESITARISKYKAKSDRLLMARHRGVHEYESHHPLLRQLDTLELLSGPAVGDRSFAAIMDFQRLQVAQRAKGQLSEAS